MKKSMWQLAALVALCMGISVAHGAPPLETYGHLPSAELMQLSPSGARYAFVGVVGEQRTLGVINSDGKPAFISKLGEIKVRNLIWADDTHLLVRITGTNDQTLDFVQAFEAGAMLAFGMDGKSFPIFRNSLRIANVVQGYFGSARVDGHLYGYFGGITYADSRIPDDSHLDYAVNDVHQHRVCADIYRIDLDSQTGWMEAPGRPGDRGWIVAPDGTVAAHSEYDEKAGLWQLFAGKVHTKVVMEKSSPTENIELLGPGRSPGTALIVDQSGEHDVLDEISLADGKIQDVLGNHNESRLLFDPDNGYLIGLATDEDPHAFFYDGKLQARYNAARKAFSGYEVKLQSYSHNLDRMIVKTDGKDDSGTYWLIDMATGKADPIGYSYPEIRSADVGPASWVKYKAADGLDIEGVLTLPPGRKPEKLPLVMLPHGGPIDIRDDIGFDWWAQAYASAGYAVFQPNYRGSRGYGTSFRQAAFGEWGRKMETDLSDGVAALVQQGLIDPKRVCIVGASYGGYAALAGVTLQQGIYRCSVSVAGLSDIPSFFGWVIELHDYTTNSETRYWRSLMGADKDGDEAMRKLSPALLADHADAPILLIHGKDDTVVPIEQSREMLAALKKADKPVDYVEMPGEDHWLSREATRETMLKASVDFVRKYNPPD